METGTVEQEFAAVAPPPRRRRAGRLAALVTAVAVLPALAGLAALALFAGLPSDLEEERFLARPDALPLAGQALFGALGANVPAWRMAGAAAIAAFAAAAAALGLRVTRSAGGAALVGLVAGTHAAALATCAGAAGTLAITATAALTGAAAIAGRSFQRAATACALLAVAALAAPGLPHLPPATAAVSMALSRPADATPAALIAPGIALVLLAWGAAGWRRGLERRFVAAAAAVAFAFVGLSTGWRSGLDRAAERVELQRFLSRLDALPPLGAGAVELVLDAPVPSLGDLAAARPARPLARTIRALETAERVRVVRWSPPRGEGFLGTLPADLSCLFEAEVDPAVRLLSPPAEASLSARSAEDEPEFRFAVDGGPPCGHDVRVILLTESPGGFHAVVRELDEATLQTGDSGDAELCAWRPSWRPMCHPERELRWEDGDVCPAGGSFWWSIAVVEDGAWRMAPLRRASVVDHRANQ
jgi:hypothetical protein